MTPEEEARALALAHEAISLESDDGVVFHIARLTVALAERVKALTVDLREACDMADENAQAATRAEAERERYRLALGALLDWVGDPDADDGCWSRWRTVDQATRAEILRRVDQLAARFSAALTPTQEAQRGE